MSKPMRVHLLVNPVAGKGKAKKALARLLTVLDEKNIYYLIRYSEFPGEMTELARTSANLLAGSKDEKLLIVGGDGSLNQAVNGVKKSDYPDQPLCYVPSGTGNDFARAIRLLFDPEKIVAHLQKQTYVRNVVCGHYVNLKDNSERYFINNLGIGIDANIVQKSNHSKLKKYLGSMIYVSNGLSAYREQDQFPIAVTVDGVTHHFEHGFLLSTTNHPYCGGGVPLLPQADPFNDALDTVVVETPKTKQLFRAVYELVHDGSHVNEPFFHYYESNRIEVQSFAPEYGQLDGEELGRHPFHFLFTTSSFKLIV